VVLVVNVVAIGWSVFIILVSNADRTRIVEEVRFYLTRTDR
jgi:hypothetical protein